MTLVALAIILILLLRGVWGVYQKAGLSEANLARERIELERLKERENKLVESLDYLKTDQGIEGEIRTKFRAVKDGERVSVIIDDESATTSQATTTPRGFWYNLFH